MNNDVADENNYYEHDYPEVIMEEKNEKSH